MNTLIRKAQWGLRQLLPLTYRSHYGEADTDRRHFCVWKMWLGRVYAMEDYII